MAAAHVMDSPVAPDRSVDPETALRAVWWRRFDVTLFAVDDA
jgi:hypothetical protein